MRADGRDTAGVWSRTARAKLPLLRIVDMGASNAWAEYAAIFARTRAAHAEHESVKAELKALVPDNAREAFGHGSGPSARGPVRSLLS